MKIRKYSKYFWRLNFENFGSKMDRSTKVEQNMDQKVDQK